jgi:SAM-dependent methyltransferase
MHRELQTPSTLDVEHLQKIRQSVKDSLQHLSALHDKPENSILDIAPQDHAGAREFFKLATIETLDIDPNSNATFIADICRNNSSLINPNRYDLVVCTEVLEHTTKPWDAAKEIARLLRPGGVLLATAPFNFRIHGPLPDCFRFTEYGWRALLEDYFLNIKITSLESPDRPLMPIHYTVVAEAK